MSRKILIIVNVDWFFLSHRLPIALEAMKEGYEVHVAMGITDKLEQLESYGLTIYPLQITRGRTSFKKDLLAFYQIVKLFRQLKPTLVHLVTIKPIIFGGIAARLTGVPAVVAAISGLGFVSVANGFMATVKRWFVSYAYRVALGKNNLIIIVQNPDDQAYLNKHVGLPVKKFRLIPGSGVDLACYKPTDLPVGIPIILMACRLIVHKGVWEFVEAAKILRKRNIDIRFYLAGDIDTDNPASLKPDDLCTIKSEGCVELLGKRNDMEKLIAASYLVVLPSYYGEGLPKILIEAAACSRAVVTTNLLGCRDAIEPNVTGLLVPPRDAQTLANTIEQLVNNPAQCAAFGKAGRKLAEKKFDINQTIRDHLQVYSELLR